jgi:SH3-like domain-containing protein
MKKSMLWIALFTAAGTVAASAETINAAGLPSPRPYLSEVV